MRVAFYAPLKPPAHPVPSGDRQIARLMMQALQMAGHDVRLISEFRSFDGGGSTERQAALRDAGQSAARQHVARFEAGGGSDDGWVPEVWLTYHLYHKAPDWLGPAVTAALGIPYVVAEASFAPKQADGRWAMGHRAVADALAETDAVIFLNPVDQACVQPLLGPDTIVVEMAPFTDTGPFESARRDRTRTRARLAVEHLLDADSPWLLAVGMMRPGDKLASYICLADALIQLRDEPWQLLIVGSGPARLEVEDAFKPIAEQIAWLGTVESSDLPPIYAAADLMVWPGINEAIGLVLLEAQATGLPVVAGDSGAASSIVLSGETGLLTSEGSSADLATSINALLADPGRTTRMGARAIRNAAARHSLSAAAGMLDQTLRRVAARQ